MTIEALLKEQNEKLERIAVALEGFNASQGIVSEDKPSAPTPANDDDLEDEDLDDMDDDDLDDDDLDDDDPPPASKKKKKTKKKVAKKKVAKKKKKKVSKKVGKTSANKGDVSKEQARDALKNVQLATGRKKEAMSILKRHGASTFGQLDENKYSNIVADAEKLLAEYE